MLDNEDIRHEMKSIERERDWTPVLYGVAIFGFHCFWGGGLPWIDSTDQMILFMGLVLVIRLLGDIKVTLSRIFHKLP